MMRLFGGLALACALLAACGGSASVPTAPAPPDTPAPSPPRTPSATTASMLAELESYITSELKYLEELLPRNPMSVTQIQAKIALLQRPTLPADIRDGARYAEGSMASTVGPTLPVSTVFPSETMRAEASQAVREIELVGPILEEFLALRLPVNSVRIWYGFVIGNRGGGGVLYMEDKGTYESRPPTTKLTYDPIFSHELAHTYISHESLTQFLEIFAYNVARTRSVDLQTWTHTRDYVAQRSSNEGVHALLDVYQLIGRDAMSRAYKTVYGLRPPYGQPLSNECKQAFANEAPPNVRQAVAEKLAKVVY